MFCTRCGKELPEGGVCSCSAEQPVQQTQPQQQVQPVQQVPPQQAQQTVQSPQPAVSKLPDSQALADGAKKAADAIKNNPIFSEVVKTLKGVIVSPVKQVSANAARNDILWMLLAVVEVLLIPFSSTTILRRSVFLAVASEGHGVKYGDYAKILKELGASAVKMYFLNLLAALVCVIVAIVVIKLLMVICKKKASFFAVANMVTTVCLPFTLLMTLGGIFSMFYLPLGLVFAASAVFVMAVLGYVGIQKLDKFTSSPFWQYIICLTIIVIIAVGTGGAVIGNIASGMVDTALNSYYGGYISSLF